MKVSDLRNDPDFYVDYVDIEAKLKHQFTFLAYLVRFWESRHDTGSSFYHALMCFFMGWNGYLLDLATFLFYTSSYWGTFAYLYVWRDTVINMDSVRWWKYSISESQDFTRRFIWYLIYKGLLRTGSAIVFSPVQSVRQFLGHSLTQFGFVAAILLWTDRLVFHSVVQTNLRRAIGPALLLSFTWLSRSLVWAIAVAGWLHSRSGHLLSMFRSSRSEYRYMPLKTGEYRVLQLQRRLPFSRLRASMIVTTADADSQYEAISYTWGDSSKTEVIIVDGQRLSISANAYAVLESCSSMWRSQCFWIDQVCIDQSDSKEKAIQVCMMFNIYRCASCVVAHLGFASLASSAVAMLIELIEHSRYQTSAVNLALLNQLPGNAAMWTGLSEMLTSPWFARVWILQEIAAAKRVKIIYGSFALDWEVFKNAVMILCRPGFRDQLLVSPHGGAKAFQGLDLLREIQDIKEETNEDEDSLEALFYKITSLGSLPHMISRTAHFQATDPRDKIFAVQALARSDAVRVAPDYVKAVDDTYIDFAHHILTEFHDPFCMMAHAGIGRPRNLELPTWVPDWTCNEYQTGFNRNRRADVIGPLAYLLGKIKFPELTKDHKEHKRVGYEASIRLRAEVKEVPDSNNKTIQVRGIMIDEVVLLNLRDQPTGTEPGIMYTDKYGHTINTTNSRMTYDWFQEAHSMAMNAVITDTKSAQQQQEEAFWRTLIGDIYEECRPAPASVKEDYDAWVYVLNSHKEICDLVAEGRTDVIVPRHTALLKAQSRSVDYIRSMGLGAAKMRFMVTREERIGIAPIRSQTGDVIFLPLGARTPWVLRRVQKGKQHDDRTTDGSADSDGHVGDDSIMDYQFVGECYVHGVMSGELLQSNLERTTTTFANEEESTDNGEIERDVEGQNEENEYNVDHDLGQMEPRETSDEESQDTTSESAAHPTEDIPGCIYVRLH